jgi:hypothetical protein
MDDLIRGSRSIHHGGVHYLAADLIWNIPYKKKATANQTTLTRIELEDGSYWKL